MNVQEQLRITLPSDQDHTGRSLGQEEIAAVSQAILSGTLTSTKGDFTKHFEQGFAKRTDSLHAVACSSGSAALHTAVAAINPEPGEEIITTSITDMGALSAILMQGAIPRFADVDPRTYNITAKTIANCISDRTRAIMVTHLFGNPCDMADIMILAKKHNLPVIEDCAQAFMSEDQGRPVGSIGDIGCFSLQQGKHITTGEGGIVVSSDSDLARRAFLFVNKAWGYGDSNPDHYFLAPNYRMNELTGAVALAQLDKLDFSVRARIEAAQQMDQLIGDIPGIGIPPVRIGTKHTYWKYSIDVDPKVIRGGTVGLGALLKERGVFCGPRYIQKPAFQCQVIRDQRTFGNSRFPFTLAASEAVDYSPEKFPGTFEALSRVLVLPWSERYEKQHVQYIADVISQSAKALT
ncbi:MAG TPA: DegT/DnrJ/EryC1/StrS family aminotransferase [Planctomycetaceae bacterium]|nr:DegT/DnrJ/EryC1/StrS family aminotransferase [Planctomycetaceae bacterium]